jgi:CRISPR/Cas system-associated exonuclease Cas4 (RecB family)
MIVEEILKAKEQKIKVYPVNANRASELGHPCLRYLIYMRTKWQERPLHDVNLQMIFDMGRVVEDAVMQDLREAGIRIVEQQRPFSWAKYQITGSIDFKIAMNGKVYPTEVKSAAPHPFASINSVQDMLHHKYLYMRKYPAQLTLYMIMDSKEEGLFLFKNKSTGELKEIWMDLDYNFAESLIQKAELINKHVAEGTLPDPIDFNENICPECPFAHICMPDRIGKEVKVLDDDRLLELLTRYDELKPQAKEFKQVDDELKKLLNGKDKLLIGNWFITGKWVDGVSYDLPDEIKEQYKIVNPYWKRQIIKAEQ